MKTCFEFLILLLLCLRCYAQSPAEGDLRLVDVDGSDGGDKGRLEVYWSSQWGTVCEDGFNDEDANVACRQLGFTDVQTYDTVGNLGLSEGTFTWLESIGCSGIEDRLIDCTHPGFGNEDCSNSDDIGLVCFSTPTAPSATLSEGDVRLVGVEGLARGMAGRVEVYYNSQWHTAVVIGTPGVIKQNAEVICGQLGFPSTVYYGSVRDLQYPQGSSGTPLLINVFCDGSESRLLDCPFSTTTGDHSNDLAVLCGGTVNTSKSTASVLNGDIRLNTENTSRPYSGRLEFYYNEQWGTVCDDGFTQLEANVACRQLGFLSALHYGTVGSIGFGEGSGSIFVDNIGCSSDPAQQLVDCTYNAIGDHDCSHSEDIALVCLQEGSLRLTTNSGGSTSASLSSGRLEVYAGGQWGTVCDDGFDQTEADLACRQLGFFFSNSFDNVDSANDFDTSLPVLLDNVDCSERTDSSLLILCDHRGIGMEDCSHSEDIDLSCSTLSLGAIIGLAVGVPVGVIGLCVCICILCCVIQYDKVKNKITNQRRPFQGQASYPAQVLNQYPTQSTAYPQQQTYPANAYPVFDYPSAPQQNPPSYDQCMH